MAAIKINNNNFESEVLKCNEPVLLDFWAQWCAPCRMLSPAVDEVADEIEGIKVGKINVDDEPALAAKFNVMSIPTLVVIKDGKEVNRSTGVIPKEAIVNLILDRNLF